MKIHIHIDSELKETEIHIHTTSYDETLTQLINRLKQTTIETIAGHLDGEIHIIKLQDVFSIFSEDGKIFLQTDEDEYELKQKLYEIEQRYPSQLIRVNKATLVNFEKIASIQSKVLGSPQLTLENGVTVPISRNYFKTLKEAFGIGGSK